MPTALVAGETMVLFSHNILIFRRFSTLKQLGMVGVRLSLLRDKQTACFLFSVL